MPSLEFLFDPGEDPLGRELEASLHPRTYLSLVEDADALVGPGDIVVDIGSRNGRYTRLLATVTGCRVVGVDAVASQAVAAAHQPAPLVGGVAYIAALMQRLPFATASVDLLFCREVAYYLPDAAAALAECRRALRPGGHLLLQSTYCTPAFEPAERARWVTALGLRPERMDLESMEATFAPAGFEVVRRDVIGSEWREAWTEAGDHWMEDDVLRVARLARREAELVGRFGRDRVEMVRGYALWGLYHLLGKTVPVVHLRRQPVD